MDSILIDWKFPMLEMPAAEKKKKDWNSSSLFLLASVYSVDRQVRPFFGRSSFFFASFCPQWPR